ncbi:MAG: hypothetical protein F6J94_18735 [Moorea sp. SIO1F2]|uniref:hypothetical protein n=1 Tax=Moorena sp. SIO1F2 TaxID=2607819 RepID=UPI0013B71355|nr:hypothetical protein [Moorena sp. SIO1F2]NET83883.1 hypothetical protein [Moorena sp. SIO1F2]
MKSIFSGLLIGSIIFLFAVLLQIGTPTESSRWIDEIYTIKSNIANSIKKPKLVIVSGSNALFGISCSQIHEETLVSCINGGTHAGLGIDYILTRAHSWLKSGDLVLLPLEYTHYTYDGKPSNVLTDYVLARDPKYLLSLNLTDQVRLISGISFKRVEQGIVAKFKTPQRINSGYQSKTINDYGDETANRKADMTQQQIKAIAKITPNDKIYESINSSHGMSSIIKFINWCASHNIKVIATWPNTVWFDVYQEPKQQEFFKSIEYFYKRHGVLILGKPEDFMYDKSMFYDTDYHLHDLGVNQRTKQLIDLIKPYLPSS